MFEKVRPTQLSTQIVLSFAIFTGILISLGTVTYYYFHNVSQKSDIVAQKTEPLVLIGRMESNISDQYVNILEQFLTADNDDTTEQYQRAVEANSRRVREKMERLHELSESETEQALISAIMDSRNAYIAEREQIFELRKQGMYEAARAHHFDVLYPKLEHYQDGISALLTYYSQQAEQAEADTNRLVSEAQKFIYFFLFFGSTLAVLMSYALTRILKRITEDRRLLEREVSERIQVEEALREAKSDLEQKVRDRTSEIDQARILLEEELVERRKVEADLALSLDELQLANAELQEFAYVASHDLQEPLRKIRAFGKRLESRFGDQLDEKALDYLRRMRNAAERMSRLIEALLRLSRVTTRGQAFVETDLNSILKDVISDFEITIESEEAKIEVGSLPTVEADPIQMGQLFQNLIGNAIKFRRDETPRVKITSEALGDKPGYWQITVEDNGIGFEEKYIDRIFTVFQRLHGRQDYQGSGIGLAICRKIVTRHGGTISAQSEPGKGSKFIIILPEDATESPLSRDRSSEERTASLSGSQLVH